ncbi:hypothetical protein QBC39DRAFT_363102, partial [Podospora conica]
MMPHLYLLLLLLLLLPGLCNIRRYMSAVAADRDNTTTTTTAIHLSRHDMTSRPAPTPRKRKEDNCYARRARSGRANRQLVGPGTEWGKAHRSGGKRSLSVPVRFLAPTKCPPGGWLALPQTMQYTRPPREAPKGI